MLEIYEALESMGLLEYGSTIKGETIRSIAGIEYPEVGTLEDFKEAQLKELSVTDYIRGKLIAKGRYLSSVKGDYRVLTPSENMNQVRSYMKSADSKLKRGIRLYDNTPKEFSDDKVKTRIYMRAQSTRKQQERGNI